MNINWRELRTTLAERLNDPFSTISTFNHRGLDSKNTTSDANPPLVKSAESVKSPHSASNSPRTPMVKSVKSAESPLVDDTNSWEWIAERAFLMECAGMDRDDAAAKAFMSWYRRFVEDC